MLAAGLDGQHDRPLHQRDQALRATSPGRGGHRAPARVWAFWAATHARTSGLSPSSSQR